MRSPDSPGIGRRVRRPRVSRVHGRAEEREQRHGRHGSPLRRWRRELERSDAGERRHNREQPVHAAARPRSHERQDRRHLVRRSERPRVRRRGGHRRRGQRRRAGVGAFSADGELGPNIRISAGTSNSHASGNGIDYGDYSGLAFLGGVAHPAWSDNSNSTTDNPDGALRKARHLHGGGGRALNAPGCDRPAKAWSQDSSRVVLARPEGVKRAGTTTGRAPPRTHDGRRPPCSALRLTGLRTRRWALGMTLALSGSAEPVAHAATRTAAPAEMKRNLHRIGNGCSASGRRRHLYQELRRRLHLEPRAKPVEGR